MLWCELATLKIIKQILRLSDVKPISLKSFQCFFVTVVSNGYAIFQCQQVAGIGPLFTLIVWKNIVAAVNDFYFIFRYVKILNADVTQQIFHAFEYDILPV